MKTGEAHGPSEVSLEFYAASGGVGIQVMADVCQRVLDGFRMPGEWINSFFLYVLHRLGAQLLLSILLFDVTSDLWHTHIILWICKGNPVNTKFSIIK